MSATAAVEPLTPCRLLLSDVDCVRRQTVAHMINLNLCAECCCTQPQLLASAAALIRLIQLLSVLTAANST